MSDEKRDYPEWLDRELFSSLNETADTPAPAEPEKAGAGERPVKRKKAAAAEKAAADDRPVK